MMFKNSPNSKIFIIVLQVLFWVFYFSYPMLKFGEQHWFSFHVKEAFLNTLFISVSVYTVVYILYKGYSKPVHYIGVLALIAILIYFNCVVTGKNCNCNFVMCYINKIVEYFFVIIFFIALISFRNNSIQRQTLERIKKEKMQAELKSIKAQMNPHFLFNTLNMLYSNALVKDSDLAEKILKLSDSLHYLMHEGQQESVPIKKEIDFIRSYIELQKARMGDKLKTDFSYDIDQTEKLIPPLLIIPFVENAFKYASMVEDSKKPVKIDIQLIEGTLKVKIENEFDNTDMENIGNEWKQSGIGIENTKRRLDLLYPSKHNLIVNPQGKIFNVELQIELA